MFDRVLNTPMFHIMKSYGMCMFDKENNDPKTVLTRSQTFSQTCSVVVVVELQFLEPKLTLSQTEFLKLAAGKIKNLNYPVMFILNVYYIILIQTQVNIRKKIFKQKSPRKTSVYLPQVLLYSMEEYFGAYETSMMEYFCKL